MPLTPMVRFSHAAATLHPRCRSQGAQEVLAVQPAVVIGGGIIGDRSQDTGISLFPTPACAERPSPKSHSDYLPSMAGCADCFT